jgi:hypothetical protein
MSTAITRGSTPKGLNEEFVRYGHRAEDPDCKACRPDYPRRCACGGLVHAQAHAHTGEAGWENVEDVYCCDTCGSAYQEEDIAEEMDEDVGID